MYLILLFYMSAQNRVGYKKTDNSRGETGNWPLHWSVKSSGESALELFSTRPILI